MGLDFVELMMELEDEFVTSIPDETAEGLTTVGAVIDFVIADLRRRSHVCAGAQSFYRLRASLVARCGARRPDVRPDAPIGLLVRKRRREWTQIASHAWLRSDPFPPEDMPLREVINTRRAVGYRREDGSIDESAVARRVFELVSEGTTVPIERLRRESRFIEDLEMG